jgi:hypothetical protein
MKYSATSTLLDMISVLTYFNVRLQGLTMQFLRLCFSGIISTIVMQLIPTTRSQKNIFLFEIYFRMKEI